jgi:hypothetical protein
MEFRERGQNESLVNHLLHNAGAIGLSRDQIAMLRHAERLERGTKKDRTRSAQIAADIQAASVRGGAADQALLRGETLTSFNDAGAVLVSNRDSLVTLFANGTFGPPNSTQARDRFEAGLTARGLYELRTGDLRSALGGAGEGGGGADISRMVMKKLAIAHDVASLGVLEHQLSAQMLLILERVVYRGGSLHRDASSGAAKRRDQRHLVALLDQAADHFGLLTGGP